MITLVKDGREWNVETEVQASVFIRSGWSVKADKKTMPEVVSKVIPVPENQEVEVKEEKPVESAPKKRGGRQKKTS